MTMAQGARHVSTAVPTHATTILRGTKYVKNKYGTYNIPTTRTSVCKGLEGISTVLLGISDRMTERSAMVASRVCSSAGGGGTVVDVDGTR